MRRDVLELRAFYGTPLGRAAQTMIGRKVAEAWGDTRGLDMLGLGYATPFLEPMRTGARRVVAAMPAAQGVEVWPAPGAGGGRNLGVLVDEDALPFPNALFDRVLAVHALEESDAPARLLTEVCRVLAPSGRLIVAVAARSGSWCHAEGTPFGHGRSYSRRQLEALLREAGLEPAGWTRALYAPPLSMLAGAAEGFEQLGARLWPPLAGVILMEAVKHTFAVKPRGVRAPARVFAPVLQPAAGGLASGRGPAASLAAERISAHIDFDLS